MSRADLEAALGRAWRGESPGLSNALLSLSWLYGAGARLHRTFAKRWENDLGVPVISVGNLVVGGAGKTPVTLEIARRLLGAGRRVAVLSRGYGRRSTERVVLVSDGDAVRATSEEGGDEPVWLARKLPGLIVAVAAKRREAATAAVDLGADILLLDDGLSHHAMPRDVDVVVVDDELRFGNGRLLPAGPLREPPSVARDAGLVWLTRCTDAAVKPPSPLEGRPLVRSTYRPDGLGDLDLRPREAASSLAGLRIAAVAGIARPKSFEAALEALGANVRTFHAFADHHRFATDEIAAIERDAVREQCDVIVTTEKDAMRLGLLATSDAWRSLRMDLSVLGDAAALDALVRRFAPTAEVA